MCRERRLKPRPIRSRLAGLSSFAPRKNVLSRSERRLTRCPLHFQNPAGGFPQVSLDERQTSEVVVCIEALEHRAQGNDGAVDGEYHQLVELLEFFHRSQGLLQLGVLR